ncbi:MAG: FAD:protein FMN transferase [Pseudomonadota bacterium]
MRRRRFLAVAAGFAAFPALAATPLRWRGRALGAEARLDLVGPEALTRPALDAALDALRRAETLFSVYDPASTLSALNRDGRLAAAPAPFLDLLDQVDRLHHLTGGLFDPTVQPVWAALARGALGDEWADVGWHHVRRHGASVHLGPRQQVTLNGIAQGYATDMVMTVLQAHGLTDAFVDMGEQAARGAPRRLGLVDPSHGALGPLTLRDGAMATSSPAATPLGEGGHILHPAGTDRPHWSSITVEAETATLADGLSTAMCLCDLPAIRGLRNAPGVRRIVLVGHSGRIRSL